LSLYILSVLEKDDILTGIEGLLSSLMDSHSNQRSEIKRENWEQNKKMLSDVFERRLRASMQRIRG
jgi:hypothetical protein